MLNILTTHTYKIKPTREKETLRGNEYFCSDGITDIYISVPKHNKTHSQTS